MSKLDLTAEKGVIALMATSDTLEEWNANCDKVKAANGGDYPPFWFSAVMASGLQNRVIASWRTE